MTKKKSSDFFAWKMCPKKSKFIRMKAEISRDRIHDPLLRFQTGSTTLQISNQIDVAEYKRMSVQHDRFHWTLLTS